MIRDRHVLPPQFSTSGQPGNPVWQTAFYLFLITLLAIPLLQPLLTDRLTCGFDTVFHLWRSVQAGALIENGVWYSRWAPQMAHGYGYPLFLFQSPLSAMATAVLQQTGLNWSAALNLVYGLGLVASGWTMWWLARTFWGSPGGLVAAVAYLYAPYHAYVAFYRASLSETVAWALPPLVLWGLYRWQAARSRRGLVTAVLCFFLLVFTHDVTAYLFLPLFVGWILLWGLDGRSWSSLGRGCLALLLGLGASAFFWLPAVVERQAIQFGRASSAWPFLYFNNFLPLEQLLALPRNADPSLLSDWPPRALGGLLLATALAGALLAWRQMQQSRWLLGFMLLGLAGTVFLTVSLSGPLWTAVPQLAAFQFPWRFLAPASFAAAFLCGGFSLIGKETKRAPKKNDASWRPFDPRLLMLSPMLAIALLSVGHWGWLYPERCNAPHDLSPNGLVAWEVATQTLGTTASGELLPRGVEIAPLPADPPAWEARLDPATLPPEASLLAAEYQPLRASIELETAVPFQAVLRVFNFPGWRVTVNGEPVVTAGTDPEGWITFPVGSGRSTIQASFGETPLRLAADGLSLLSFFLLGFIWRAHRYSVSSKQYSLFSIQSIDHQPLVTGHWLLVVLAILLLAGKLLLVDAERTPLRQPRLQDGTLTGVAQPLNVTLGTPDNPTMVRLFGLGEWDTAVPADRPLVLRLYWQALQPLAENYRVGLTLQDESARRWSEAGLRDYRWQRNPPPTTAWPTERYALTAYFVDPLPGISPGGYRLKLSFFAEETLAPLTFYAGNGQPIGPELDLGAVTLLPPEQPWPVPEDMAHRLDFTAGPVTLLGSSVDRTQAAPGDPTLVTLFWSSTKSAEVRLSLVNEAGEPVVNWPVTLPAHGAGTWRSQQLLRLPVTLADGRYQWQLAFPGGQTARWGELTISAPERIMTLPAVETAVNVTLGDRARLAGFSLGQTATSAGEALKLELVWQGLAEMPESYRVFVHLLAADGSLVAQSDGLPAGWTRPTTGWLPGEFIRDSHTIRLPAELAPGDYALVTGLYLPDGIRLRQPDGQDGILLTAITIASK